MNGYLTALNVLVALGGLVIIFTVAVALTNYLVSLDTHERDRYRACERRHAARLEASTRRRAWEADVEFWRRQATDDSPVVAQTATLMLEFLGASDVEPTRVIRGSGAHRLGCRCFDCAAAQRSHLSAARPS